MTTYSYLRVSTNKQDVAMQREAISAKGVSIPEGHEYVDHAISGTVAALEREGFKAMYDVLEIGDTVYAYSLSRVGRDTVDILNTIDMLDSKGVSVIFIADGIMTGGATGKFILTVLAAAATMEKDLNRERAKAGFAKEGMHEKLRTRPLSVAKKGLLEAVKALHKQHGKMSINVTKAALESLGHECSRAAVANYISTIYNS